MRFAGFHSNPFNYFNTVRLPPTSLRKLKSTFVNRPPHPKRNRGSGASFRLFHPRMCRESPFNQTPFCSVDSVRDDRGGDFLGTLESNLNTPE